MEQNKTRRSWLHRLCHPRPDESTTVKIDESMTVNIDGMNATIVFDCDGIREITGRAIVQRNTIKEIGARSMIEALKADRLIPDEIDKEKAASEAIRRSTDPMSAQIPITDMVED